MKNHGRLLVALAVSFVALQLAANSSVARAVAANAIPNGSAGAPGSNPWDLLQTIVSDWNGGFKNWQSVCTVYGEAATACAQTVPQAHGFNAGKLTTSLRVEAANLTANSTVAANCIADLPLVDEAIWFNQQAARDAASALQPASPKHPIAFNPGGVVIRAEFEVIPRQNGIVCLHLYDTTVSGTWTTAVFPVHSVDLDKKDCSTWAGADPIPVGCFFSPTLNNGNLAFYQGPNQEPLATSDTLILIGFHVIEKQDPVNWLWSTFWWQANQSLPAKGQNIHPHFCTSGTCLSLPPQWKRYAMNFVDTAAGSGQIQPVFNPYLDGASANAPNINCLVCHSFAAAHGKPTASADPHMGAMANISQAKLNSVLAKYFTSKMRKTDKIWSLANRLTLSGSASVARATSQ